MSRKVLDLNVRLGNGLLGTDGNSCLVHRFHPPRNQWVPPHQILTFCHKPVCAGRRKPGDRIHNLGSQLDTIGNVSLAVGVVRTSARAGVEERTGDVGEMDFAAVLVLQFHETAATAAVA